MCKQHIAPGLCRFHLGEHSPLNLITSVKPPETKDACNAQPPHPQCNGFLDGGGVCQVDEPLQVVQKQPQCPKHQQAGLRRHMQSLPMAYADAANPQLRLFLVTAINTANPALPFAQAGLTNKLAAAPLCTTHPPPELSAHSLTAAQYQ